MKEQGIFGAFSFSLLLHVMLVVVMGIIARHSNLYRLPSPYTVSLVDVSNVTGSYGGRGKEAVQESAQSAKIDPGTRMITDKYAREDNALVDERINALRAKKKIEKMLALRKVVDIGIHNNAAAPLSGPAAKNSKAAGGSPSGSGDYYSLVVGRIRQQWIYPESLNKDLEATVSIKIAKDGNVAIDGIEKSSGNRLFDRSVLSAISKASPLPAPPQEMEIGVRFKP